MSAFVSMRRHYLDLELERHKGLFRGVVLDVGGKRKNRRGSFVPPVGNVSKWIVLNSDASAGPDICCKLPGIPLEDHSVDTVLMTEVMEYIYDFGKLITEISRVLKKDGAAIISVPFLNPLHGDYQSDYYRFTESWLRERFNADFEIAEFVRMGAAAAVIYDIMRVQLSCGEGIFLKRAMLKMLKMSSGMFIFLDRLFKNNFHINTGFFMVCKVKKAEIR